MAKSTLFIRPVAVLVLALLASGCGGSIHEEERRRLVEYERRIPGLEKDLEACRANEQTLRQNEHALISKINTYEGVVGDKFASAEALFEQQRQEIVVLIPEEVRQQVNEQLDELYGSLVLELQKGRQVQGKILKQVERISDCTDEIAEARARGDAKVAALEVQIASLSAELEATRGDGAAVAQARAANLQSLVDDLARFDRRISCKDCEGRIKMGRREEAIRAVLEFHRELSSRLGKLAASADSP